MPNDIRIIPCEKCTNQADDRCQPLDLLLCVPCTLALGVCPCCDTLKGALIVDDDMDVVACESCLDNEREAVAERQYAYDNDEHERAAAHARGNDFEDTDGRDWT